MIRSKGVASFLRVCAPPFIGLFVSLLIGVLTPPAFAQNPPGFSGVTGSAMGQINGSLQVGKSWVMGDSFGDAMQGAFDKNTNQMETTMALSESSIIGKLTLDLGGCVGIAAPSAPNAQNSKYCQQANKVNALNGTTGAIVAMIQNPPASTAMAFNDFGTTLGFLPKQTYAQGQGIGFSGLTPLLPIWKGFRNVAYGILSIIMIVIGFMVMLRKKIDAKTVVTVQNALPKIVVTLILITFSYAIVGFMIDLMYVITAVGIAMLGPAGYKIGVFGNIDATNLYLNQNGPGQGGIMVLFMSVFGPLVNLFNPFSGAWGNAASNVGSAVQTLTSGNILPGLMGIVGGVAGGAFQTGAQLLLGPILLFILLVAFLIAFIRILFMLLSAYINIILALLIGPLQILLSALPGGDGFGSWIKNLFMNLIPFPITILILILANWLGSSATQAQVSGLWIPPLLPQASGGTVANFAYTLIWLGLVMSIPTIVGSIKEMLKSKPAIPAGIGAITGSLGGGAMQGLQLAYYASQVKSMFGGGKPQPNPFTEQFQALADSQKDILGKIGEIGGRK